MSSRDPDLTYQNLPQAFRFFAEQLCKTIHTAIPGIVVNYDRATNRATVHAAVDLLLTDGTTRPRPLLTDVPVLWPSGGGFTFTWPLTAGDGVLLVFCERDISAFKQDRTARRLPSNRVLAEADAVAVAGFGAAGSWTPATTAGVALQTDDGDTAVVVEDGHIVLRADRVTIDYDGGSTSWP